MSTLPPLDVRARMLAVQRLIIDDSDPERLDGRLAATLAQAPALFDRAPVALDLSAVLDRLDEAGLGALLRSAAGHGLVVFALAGPREALQSWCDTFHLAWMDERDRLSRPRGRDGATLSTRVVTQPVRSGQQIYARGAHLVVMNQVSAGAEVIADGSIHVFGTLRGRALAGVQGLTGADIVCQRMDADLLAIAGTYRVRDDLPEAGGAARAWLEGDALHVETY